MDSPAREGPISDERIAELIDDHFTHDEYGRMTYADPEGFARALLAEKDGWQPMSEAPKDSPRRLLAVVDGAVRFIKWGKTSHLPLYGWCLADQGPEDFDLCEPMCWMHKPSPPEAP